MKTAREEDKALIAIPYYGTLSLPPSGLTRIFFLVQVDLAQMAIDSLTLQVWNPKKDPNLFRWLRQLDTAGVICSDAPSKYEVGIHAEGMWVQWGQEGEVHEVVHKWLRNRSERPKTFSFSGNEIPLSATLKHAWELG